MSIKQEIKDFDKEYLNKKYSLMLDFIKSKLEYWQEIPKAYYIYEGKNGYRSWYALTEKKMYRLRDSYLFVHCLTGELYYNDYSNKDFKLVKDKYSKQDFALSYFSDSIDSIDGERIYDALMADIRRTKHTNMGNGIEPEEWIKGAIVNNIDITLTDYILHYDDNHGMTENDFNKKKEKYTVKLAKENLLDLPKKT